MRKLIGGAVLALVMLAGVAMPGTALAGNSASVDTPGPHGCQELADGRDVGQAAAPGDNGALHVAHTAPGNDVLFGNSTCTS